MEKNPKINKTTPMFISESRVITHLLLNMYLKIDKSFEPIVPTVAANVWIF